MSDLVQARVPTHPVWSVPLSGTSLVEASAGTGKTWTICGLYLRLLLEKRLLPQEILTVTFTNAASAELKARIRGRLVALRDALNAADSASDDRVHFSRAVPEPGVLKDLVRSALASFEECVITTIHGFCQRVLTDHAFEIGLPFAMEVLDDEEAMLKEAAADLWRQELSECASAWMHYARGRVRDPQALLVQLKKLRGARAARLLLPPRQETGADTLLCERYVAARTAWGGNRQLALDAFPPTPAGRKRAHACAQRLDDYFAGDTAALQLPPPEVLDVLRSLTESLKTPAGSLNKRKGSGDGSLANQLRASIEALCGAADAARAEFEWRYADLLVRCNERLNARVLVRKLGEGRLFFEDLVLRVRAGLEGASGDRLAASLRASYRAALIDEFQDTDRDQYAIFERTFGADGHPLYLVGDPKQAIYRFRGADIHAYLAARSAARQCCALLENRRSAPALVGAVSAIFENHWNPFLNSSIEFRRASGGAQVALQRADGTQPAPLQWWWLSGESRLRKQAARAVAVAATVDEIERLLEAGARHELALVQSGRPGRALVGSDIAVLTGTHRESEMVRAALNERGIACTTQTMESVLASEQARDMALVLRAVARPGDARWLKAALATELVGENGLGIAAMETDVARWDACVAEFERYSQLARSSGWLRAWHALLVTRNVASRSLADLRGARKLTNFRHLAELIDARTADKAWSLEAVAESLLQGSFEAGVEECELRLESDEELVRIMTVHSAKGLEFPVVFCPFLWNSRTPASSEATGIAVCHDDNGMPLLDLGSPDYLSQRDRQRIEEIAEWVRLAYVAMTRAQARCYIACGLVNQCHDSPLAWLLHGAGWEGPATLAIERLKARYDPQEALQLRGELDALVRRAGAAMEVREVRPEVSEPPPRGALRRGSPAPHPAEPRRFGRRLHARSTASFSSVAASAEDPDNPDHDQHLRDWTTAVEAEEDSREPPRFPRGARAGSCLHVLFEKLSPAQVCATEHGEDSPALWSTINRTLRAHGIEARYGAAAFGLIRNALLTRLSPEVPPLAQIGTGQRLLELAFHARVVRPQPLAELIASYRRAALLPALPSLEQLAVPAGYLKGYIDLVFEHEGRYYVVDYKSNSLPGYGADVLAQVIAEELYDVQYLLYAAALTRYLRSRVPGYNHERHFGGVFYLFLRGMRPATGFSQGVYFARPELRFLQQIAQWSGPQGAVQ